MDDSRRRVFRRESVTIELESGLELVARPLPWQQRNDFGDLIMQDYLKAMNESLQAIASEDESTPQLIGALADKLRNLDGMFKAAFPEVIDDDLITSLTYEEILNCIMVALDVNKLDKLKPLIDPNFQAPGLTSGNLGALADGAKITSLPVSSEPALVEAESSN